MVDQICTYLVYYALSCFFFVVSRWPGVLCVCVWCTDIIAAILYHGFTDGAGLSSCNWCQRFRMLAEYFISRCVFELSNSSCAMAPTLWRAFLLFSGYGMRIICLVRFASHKMRFEASAKGPIYKCYGSESGTIRNFFSSWFWIGGEIPDPDPGVTNLSKLFIFEQNFKKFKVK